MKVFKKACIAALLFGAAGSAISAVTFDPVSGTGFVGKGDVQLAFGWNNAQLQANQGNVTFSYQTVEIHTAVCTWITGEGTRGQQTHNVSHKKKTGVFGALAFDERTRKQITGYNLTGYNSLTQTTGAVPVVGGPCPGNPGTEGTWTSVALTSSTAGLFAVLNGSEARIWPSL